MPNLFQQHQQILEAAEALLAAVKDGPGIPMPELARLRNRLASLIRAHGMAEQEEIYRPLLAGDGLAHLPEVATAMRRLQDDKSRYSASIRHWTLQAIEQDWDGYVAMLSERVGDLRAMIRREESEVYRPIMAYQLSKAGDSLRQGTTAR